MSELGPTACSHPAPVEVRGTITNEVVAQLCPDCDAQLPAEFDPTAYPPIGLRQSGY